MAAKALEIGTSGMVFLATSLRVEIAFLTGRNSHGLNDALVKLSGGQAQLARLDGKILRCEGLPTGREQALAHRKQGQSYNLIRSADAWKTAEIYINNQTFKVKRDETLSKESSPEQLLREYTQRLDSTPGRIPIEDQIKDFHAETANLNWNGSVNIQWNEKIDSREAHQSVHATLTALPAVFKSLLSDDSGRREALKEYPSLVLNVVDGFGIEAMKKPSSIVINIGESYGTEEVKEVLNKVLQKQF